MMTNISKMKFSWFHLVCGITMWCWLQPIKAQGWMGQVPDGSGETIRVEEGSFDEVVRADGDLIEETVKAGPNIQITPDPEKKSMQLIEPSESTHDVGLLAEQDAGSVTIKSSRVQVFDFEAVKARAQAGDNAARVALGRRYKYGIGVSQDHVIAAQYFKEAFLAKSSSGATEYALMLRDGLGVGRSQLQSIQILLQAEKVGDRVAQYQLGQMFQNGSDGVPKNLMAAAGMYLRSARQGYAKAQNNLAYMLQNGVGVPQNHFQAVRYYKMAAEQGLTVAQYNLALYYLHGEFIQKNRSLAAKWFEKAAKNGHVKSQYQLATLLESGKGVQKDRQAAFYWYSKAADQNHKPSFLGVARYYLNADDPNDGDYRLARTWLERTLPTKDPAINEHYGYLLMYGLGGPKDEAGAIEYFKVAADQGYLEAQYELGSAYIDGDGIPIDKDKAYYWLESAATQGHRKAIKLLCQLKAQGVKSVPCLK